MQSAKQFGHWNKSRNEMKTGLKSSTKLSSVTINGFCDIWFHTKLKMICQITVNFMLMIVINHVLYSSFNLIHLPPPPKFKSVVQLTQPSVSDSAWQPLWGGGDVLRSSAAPPQPLPRLPSELPWWVSVWPIPCTRQSVRALWAPCTFPFFLSTLLNSLLLNPEPPWWVRGSRGTRRISFICVRRRSMSMQSVN